MHTKSFVRISALMLSVALVATPAFAADSVASKQGTPGTSRAAPFVPPGKLSPMPVPKVDASGLSRGPLALDPAAAADSMATITHSADGSDTETPASGALRDLLTEAVKSNGGQSMSTDRVVSANDAREQITDTTQFPAYTVGWLIVQDQKGNYATCTGTLIGPHSVITAAHCVYDHDTGGWVKSVIFAPGATDAQTAPFGTFEWNDANILKGFVSNYDGKNYGSAMPWDLAEIELKDDAGNQLGWLGFRVDDATDFKATILGYPGDKPDGTMWKSSCDVPAANFGDQLFWHVCDTYAGSSGSAMWEVTKDDTYIRGINVAEDDKVNYGVRLIKPYYQFLQDNYK